MIGRWASVDMSDAQRRAVLKLLRRAVQQPHEFVEDLTASEIVAAQALLTRLEFGERNR